MQNNPHDQFPADEDFTSNSTDAYALAKQEAELRTKASVDWLPEITLLM